MKKIKVKSISRSEGQKSIDFIFLLQRISQGEFDDKLNQLSQVIEMRQKSIGRRLLHSVEIGDEVQFQNNARPTYLVGLIGKVKEIRRTKITVSVPPIGRFRSGSIICLPSLLEKVEE